MRHCAVLFLLALLVGCSTPDYHLRARPDVASSVQKVKTLSLVGGVPVELGQVKVPEILPVTIRENWGVVSGVSAFMGSNADDIYYCSAREIVSSIFQTAIDLNFRVSGEDVPLAVLSAETVSCILEVKDEKAVCDLRMNVSLFEKGEEGEGRRVLFRRSYTRNATSPFVEGKVPEAFSRAVGEICNAFLADLGRTRYLMTQMVEGDFSRRTGSTVKKPVVLKFAYSDDEKNTGTCLVDFGEYDVQAGDAWAIRLIKKACYDKMGATFDNEAVRFKIDKKAIANNKGAYQFSVRMLKEYEVSYKPHPVNKGEITLNYGLMKKTPEEAYQWAKNSIEMILNDQGIVIQSGSAKEKAQYQLGPIMNNSADKSITVSFWLVN